ncbi:hypothetical protein [Fictibacillus sp. 18YEL24]|uniref:hypothetical protein n=1 Tax=Fictibacillus sp. 18YEL24 TaxID=2745875 RepID=UPI0018CE1721|nr:hypothetical protein [Fictibacillus sp. 18YEL24]MBH0171492.1 hypothetical protein [Fictibacillus sp. 18YEL24]
MKRFAIGLFLLFIGLGMLELSFFGGLILSVLGALPLLNSFTSNMVITNNAGQCVNIEMSIIEKDKVQQFINKVNVAIADAA